MVVGGAGGRREVSGAGIAVVGTGIVDVTVGLKAEVVGAEVLVDGTAAEQPPKTTITASMTARINNVSFFIEVLLYARQFLISLIIYTEIKEKYYKGL